MKHLFVLMINTLLFTSINAQVKINFSELQKANSKEDFVRICLSNGFEHVMDDEYKTTLAFEFNDIDSTAVVWAYCYNSFESFKFIIYDVGYYNDQNGLYQNLTAGIKKCPFGKTFIDGFGFENNLTYALYSWRLPTFNGKIGFCIKTEDGVKVGRISTFDNDYIEFCEASREDVK